MGRRGMRRRGVVLDIDDVILETSERPSASRLTEEVRDELARLVAARGLPTAPERSENVVACADVNPDPVGPRDARGAAKRLAQAVYEAPARVAGHAEGD